MRPTVNLDREVTREVERYTLPGAPIGALGRVLIEWGVALMDMAPRLDEEEARALLAVAREWRPRPRFDSGEPRIGVELRALEHAIVDEGTTLALPHELLHRLVTLVRSLDELALLGLLLRLAWACEVMDLKPGRGRAPQTFEDAVKLLTVDPVSSVRP